MYAVRCSLLSLLAAAAICAPAISSILRVKSDAPGPTHDGTTWTTAFLKVQTAVTASHPGDEIWVASGTYAENVQIAAATPVSLYGGFAGTETARNQRTLPPSATILDGGGVATVIAIRASGVTVDGFTIRGGSGNPFLSGNPDLLELQGSGIACMGAGVTIAHNIISGNSSHGGDMGGLPLSAGSGGGIYCTGANALIDSNVITGNQAFGIASINYGWPGYFVGASGAGVYVDGFGAVIRGNTITDNTIAFSKEEPSSEVGSGFTDGFRANGGGIACGDATIVKNVIARNSVTAISWSRTTRGAVEGTGTASGGGIYATGACNISGNLIYGNTILNNSAGSGAGVYCGGASALTNNTVANNLKLSTLGSPYADDYVATGGARTNNIFGLSPDPLFVNAAAGDYHLMRGSPMIDAGDDSAVQPGDTDLDGNPRIRGAHVDMGCYEAPTSRRVKWNAPGPTHDGTTWTTAFLKVGDALTASAPGDDVWVAAGTYKEAVTLNAGRSLLGGFAGTETSADQRNPTTNVTILDGTNKAGPVVSVKAAGLETADLDGFTVQGGYGEGTWTTQGCVDYLCRGSFHYGVHWGAGVYIYGGAPRISNNRIVNNDAAYGYDMMMCGIYDACALTGGPGGGVYVEQGSPSIVRNFISGNKATQGGAIYVHGGNPRIADNLIANNSATYGGAGVFITVDSNTPSPNVVSVLNNTFTQNAPSGGGAIYISMAAGTQAIPVLANNIIASNDSGILVSGNSSPTFSHNCMYLNTSFDYQGVADPTGTDGNISLNPQFKDAANKDYHLLVASLCIDAGDDSVVMEGDADLDGKPRVRGAHVDLGAYEYPSLGRIYVNCKAAGPVYNGVSWSTAFKTLQEGIDAVDAGGQVWVAEGTYPGNNIRVKPNVSLLGGFAGNEFIIAQRDVAKNTTLLDGIADSSGAARFPVLKILGSGVTIDGFTIRNGSEFTGYGSGGIPGAAIRYDDYPGRSDSFTISHNDIGACYGSAIYCGAGSVPTISHNRIHDNSKGSEGGAVRLNGSVATIRDNLITGNTVSSVAGGIRVYASAATITNNTIAGSPDASGIGIASFGQSVVCANNIVAFNGGGIGLTAGTNSGAVTLRNNDVFGNTSWNYLTIPDPTGTAGSIGVEPQFTDRVSGDYHLFEGSFCIDSGDDSYVQSGDTDLDGKPRIQGGHVDLGCYEFPTPTTVTITDIAGVLRVAGGIWAGTPESMNRVNPDKNGFLTIEDAVLLARKMAGLSQ